MDALLQEDFNIIETISELDERFKIVSCLMDKRIDNSSIITLKSISQYTGLSMKKVVSFINLLEEKDLIHRQCNGAFKLSNKLLNLNGNTSLSNANPFSKQTKVSYRCNYDHDWSMLSISEGWFHLTEYTSNCLIQNKVISANSLICEEYRDFVWAEVSHAISKRRFFSIEFEIQTASGRRKWIKDIGRGIFDSDGNVQALEGIFIDISTEKEYEEYHNFIIEHDKWTKLYNLNYLLNLLKGEATTDMKGKAAIIVININPINYISFTYHFEHVQELIRTISEALSVLCTNELHLYNQFNNFAFYIDHYKDRNDLLSLIQEISKTLSFFKEKVNAGIGIIEMNDFIVDVEEVLHNVFTTLETAANNPDQSIQYHSFNSDGIEIIDHSKNHSLA
ncbi:MAG: domain S-box [Neobacillus sp.]|jgi:PAS domain S-box-containing protein|nr:domain S-box [Neobacillus sp.]